MRACDLVKFSVADLPSNTVGGKKAFIGRAIAKAENLYDAELTAAAGPPAIDAQAQSDPYGPSDSVLQHALMAVQTSPGLICMLCDLSSCRH